MTSPHSPDEYLAGADHAAAQQRRRLAEVHAREHVGAAGWAQSSTLESIIRAGQEGLMATEALRRVVDLTGEQLRGLPLGTAPDERAGQAATLRGVMDRGQGQLDAARHLDDLVCRALEEVSATPLTQISVSRLQAVQTHLQTQVEALHTIIASAHAQAATVEQVQQLDRVIAEHQQRVRDLRLESAGSEAGALATAGESIVQRLGELDEAAPAQLGALNRIGHAVADQVSESGGTPEQKAETLEHLAQNMQDRADDLRRDPE
ncbi:hypothetical protein HNQ07_002569 [Deinococcus metalli]|uniref:Uncharacterized protein n=1 Tax=Deinococcus metalli TaxID=1141878 RepID=A0A7W8KFC5_9DEIO|nr:hypothetical protein [Deinococcus metalli]MBB5377096.1 hypothetical protein [Deinococcus metalli]GHF49031.1 hypothetical protein GCM10017781_26790 [Deinococcus metalli]